MCMWSIFHQLHQSSLAIAILWKQLYQDIQIVKQFIFLLEMKRRQPCWFVWNSYFRLFLITSWKKNKTRKERPRRTKLATGLNAKTDLRVSPKPVHRKPAQTSLKTTICRWGPGDWLTTSHQRLSWRTLRPRSREWRSENYHRHQRQSLLKIRFEFNVIILSYHLLGKSNAFAWQTAKFCRSN